MSEPPDNIDITIGPGPTNATIEVAESDPVITNPYDIEKIDKDGTSTYTMTYTAKNQVLVEWSWSKSSSTRCHFLQSNKGPNIGTTSITVKGAQEKDAGIYYLTVEDNKTHKKTPVQFELKLSSGAP